MTNLIIRSSARQMRRRICARASSLAPSSSTSFQHIILCTATDYRRPIVNQNSHVFFSNTSHDDKYRDRDGLNSAQSHLNESNEATNSNDNDNNSDTTTISSSLPPQKSNISNLAELSKARLSALVVSTTAFGFLSAGPTALAYTSLPTFAAASIGTALCASSAATFNQVIEIDRDSKMKRTGNRPLVSGAVSKEAAIGLGCLTGSTGGILLGMGTDPITTMLGVGNIGLYAGLYTYLKPRSELNTWVGAVVGAIPPVMGWTAAGGSILDPEAVMLGSTLFLWQFPHFFALNWMYRTDYKRGGFAMVAVNDPNGDRTATLIKRYGVYLASLPFLSTVMEVTSPMFAIEGILLNGYALYVASKFDKERSNANARKVFLTSLWYLPCVMMLFLFHSRRWHEDISNEDRDETIIDSFQTYLSKIQAKGKELCMHEALVSKDVEVSIGEGENKTSLDGSKCPISVTKNAQMPQVQQEGGALPMNESNGDDR